jgi:hypothetical protein
MASKEIISINGKEFAAVNIAAPVGKGQPNRPEDVRLIQAMFQVIAAGLGPARLGLKPGEVPEPTGNFEDGKTENAIWKFQRKNALKVRNVDGIIHPAAYKGRDLTHMTTARLMSITLLHNEISDAKLFLPGATGTSDYIEDIVRRAPALKPHLSSGP